MCEERGIKNSTDGCKFKWSQERAEVQKGTAVSAGVRSGEVCDVYLSLVVGAELEIVVLNYILAAGNVFCYFFVSWRFPLYWLYEFEHNCLLGGVC